MKSSTKAVIAAIAAVVMLCVGVVTSAISIQHVSALGDPVATVTAPDHVVAGSTITFDLTIDQPGFAPTGYTQKIQLRTLGGGTNNFANYSVIPMQTLAGPVWRFTWVTPAQYYDNRIFIFSVPFCVSTARICRTVAGVKFFTLDPVPVPVV